MSGNVGIAVQVARKSCGSSSLPIPSAVSCRPGRSESKHCLQRDPIRVRCRAVSSENIGAVASAVDGVRCRLGSSETVSDCETHLLCGLLVLCRPGNMAIDLKYVPVAPLRGAFAGALTLTPRYSKCA